MPGFVMPEDAQFSELRLRVRDLAAELGFWRDLLGIPVRGSEGRETTLAPDGGMFRLILHHDPSAVLRPSRGIGLYHVALLLPDRTRLAALIRRLLDASCPGFEGASDHGVSEAFYLHSPEGNGLELYADRPRDMWPKGPGEEVAMYTEPLDVEGLLGTASSPAPADPMTRIGHIHLHVADLASAEAFYAGTLGLGVTQRGYRGALFFATGGYHHHIGANIWAGSARPQDGTTGLVDYAWTLPGNALGALRQALGDAAEASPGGLELPDPSGAKVHLYRPG